MKNPRDITVVYTSIDYFKKRKRYKSLKCAQKFAQYYLDETPTFGPSYAVSDDGVGRITVSGATLSELFPKAAWQHERELEEFTKAPLKYYEDDD